MKVNYAIVFVSDMPRAIAFYQSVVGLPLKFQSPHWTEFVSEGATLALHLADDDDKPGSCRPGFNVPDLDAFHRKMIESKVRCVQEPKDVFGSRVAQYVDPDGLAFSVGEERRGR